MAGEDQLTATTHAAFAYTGSGYKKLKSADTDYCIRKQWVAGMREQVQDGGESGNKETQTQAHNPVISLLYFIFHPLFFIE